MYRSITSRRLLTYRHRIHGFLSSSSKTTGEKTSTPWQGSQLVSFSSTPNLADESEAPWDSVEELHTQEGCEWDGCRRDFMTPIEIGVRGPDILHNPFFNKGTAFKTEERDRLRFRGLLPARFNNIKMQIDRFLVTLRATESDIQKNILLEDLHDLNETLYHRILVDHIEEMAPLIYTPTVGQACQELSQRFRRPRGMYFSEQDRGHMASMVYNWPQKDVHVIVVTDGSRILGLGDLGANGMGIPIGKLSLYCAAGGIPPHRVLPVVLDVGTDNEELLNDEFYLGVNKKRLRGKEYYHLVDEFMNAVRHRWPNVLVQFEDFDSSVAQRLLDKYREDHLCFNDDIQGTGATALAGLLGALRAKGADVTSLGDQRIAIAGAGSAGIGIAQVLYEAMLEQGYSEEAAKDAFFIVDQNGLLGKDRMDELNAEQQQFARDEDNELPLIDVVKKFKPTILLGVTAFGGLFTEDLIREMATHVDKPIIFPLSNPTIKSECTAAQAYEWTNGNLVFASGSPFDPVDIGDGKKYTVSQCNNMYIFPGLGLGASLCGAKKVTDRMLYLGAKALAECLTPEDAANGQVFPHISNIRMVSRKVAVAVIEEAIATGIATKISADDRKDINAFVAKRMYFPEYVPLIEKRTISI
mmetsp:Transcript_26003/g.55696  ORF Transcript_26003/g.55696 Transcript_26003/m.55696 type:complete len:640 (-) Transcript_26003:1467-3386(-)|eukprot:CAMPEP_0201122544 /NCGR_PEP_ID=MMETSP0850-20130426/6153_1 /ASSEMBLY_ACC=CAM_ASM_000622 /TAXON_ID=183588 /ORGANISM="Pseudo-nitzschia fraudulenta, Strain WWA7" /LENGTH=639 /DNA_ID=CAMNT_0047389255 /DNA_START=56 /DNA_END=1975 /DNA_ORIENTATION=-